MDCVRPIVFFNHFDFMNQNTFWMCPQSMQSKVLCSYHRSLDSKLHPALKTASVSLANLSYAGERYRLN